MKKTNRLLASALLAACILSSCSNETTNTSSTAAESSSLESTSTAASETNLNPDGEFPLFKETQKISMLLAQNPNVEDYDTNTYTKRLEELANVDLEFVLLPSNDF